jgi:hypothetical protein
VKRWSRQRAIMWSMDSLTPEPATQGTRSQRWLARLSFGLAALAVVIVALFAGLRSSRARR